jgi:hypothetical protein
MQRILSSPDLIAVTRLKDVLEQAGVPCVLRNELSAGLSPEIPLTDSTPELWIQNDHDYARAQEIKGDMRTEPEIAGSAWKCPACGEAVEPQFSSCWKCGASKT